MYWHGKSMNLVGCPILGNINRWDRTRFGQVSSIEDDISSPNFIADLINRLIIRIVTVEGQAGNAITDPFDGFFSLSQRGVDAVDQDEACLFRGASNCTREGADTDRLTMMAFPSRITK